MKVRLKVKHCGTVRNIQGSKDNDLTLVCQDQEIEAIKDNIAGSSKYFKNLLKDFEAFFVETLDGQYSRILACYSSIPILDQDIYKIQLWYHYSDQKPVLVMG